MYPVQLIPQDEEDFRLGQPHNDGSCPMCHALIISSYPTQTLESVEIHHGDIDGRIEVPCPDPRN